MSIPTRDVAREALVPLDTLAAMFEITERTLRRWLDADGIERVRFGDGYKAVKWGDIEDASRDRSSNRWARR
jgi:hypothetical protein